jgi:chromosome segregation ATPase
MELRAQLETANDRMFSAERSISSLRTEKETVSTQLQLAKKRVDDAAKQIKCSEDKQTKNKTDSAQANARLASIEKEKAAAARQVVELEALLVDCDAEEQRLRDALEATRDALELLRQRIGPATEHRLLLDAQLLMHRDELLINGAIELLREFAGDLDVGVTAVKAIAAAADAGEGEQRLVYTPGRRACVDAGAPAALVAFARREDVKRSAEASPSGASSTMITPVPVMTRSRKA